MGVCKLVGGMSKKCLRPAKAKLRADDPLLLSRVDDDGLGAQTTHRRAAVLMQLSIALYCSQLLDLSGARLGALQK